MRRLHLTLLLYLTLLAIFTPFTFHFISFQHSITEFLFGGLTESMANGIGLKIDPFESFSSDSIQLYLLYVVLFPISFLLVFGIKRFALVRKNIPLIKDILTSFLVYFLALITLKYGLDKLNGNQFYFPEPNLLFTPLGYLDKDILYWSVMGASPGYVRFLGVIELLTALLILFRRTRVVGIVFALITYTQVVAINFGFDISVKLFSSFLLVITLTLLYPYFLTIYHSLKYQQPILFQKLQVEQWKKYFIVKSLALVFILVESCYPAYVSYKQNHATPNEGNMYGAYEVINPSNPRGIKRIFIHKDDYLIIQTEDDDFIDYRLQWSKKEDAIYLTDYDNQTLKVPYRWHNTDSLEFIVNNNPIICTPIDIEKLPLRQKLFHWMVDTQ